MSSRGAAKLKVILDTSILVAAVLSRSGGSARMLELVLSGRMFHFHTDEILEELREVLRRPKFGLSREAREHFVGLLVEASFAVEPLPQFKVMRCRDPKDDVFLSLSRQVEADYLVSLDLDLLDLGKEGSTRIVQPGQLLLRLKRDLEPGG